MSDITSGSVTIEDGVKKSEEYAPARKVSVTISFTVSPGTAPDAILDAAAGFANKTVDELLGRTPRPTAAAQPAEADKPARAARSKKADPAPPASSTPSDASAGKEGSADPFDTGGESPEVAAERARLQAELAGDAANNDEFTVQPEDEFDVTVAPPAEITDAELNSAVQKKNTEISNAVAIRTLIGSYNPDPKRQFQLREIPQAQRQDFLDKLALLKKAA